jgi:DNA-binding transcriptional LysR family regulator
MTFAEYARMDLSALEVFADVVRKGSLSAVARERDVAPSSISRTITALEADLGARLFQRTTRRIAPTEAALLFLARIEPHLEGLRRAREAVSDATETVSGVLRVTASPSFGGERIGPLHADFASRYPSLKVELVLTDRVVDLVAERFDLALRHGPLPDSTLVVQPLVTTRYHVVASPTYVKRHGKPRTPADLARHQCLTFPLPGFATFWRFRDEKGRTEEAPVSGRIVVNSGVVLRRCALDGAGIVLLSDWLVGPDMKRKRLVDLFPRHRVTPSHFETAISAVYPSRQQHRVTPSHFETAISAVYPSRQQLPRKVRALIDFLKERL